jgi:hypothetical protein
MTNHNWWFDWRRRRNLLFKNRFEKGSTHWCGPLSWTLKMKTDMELRSDAMLLLRQTLGLVEAERFLALVQRDKFNYTNWRSQQWVDCKVSELAREARKLREARTKD